MYTGYVISSATHIRGDSFEMKDIDDLSRHFHPDHLPADKYIDIPDDERFDELFRFFRTGAEECHQERLD